MNTGRIPTSIFRALRFQDPDVDALRKITDAEWERILSNWSTAKIMTSFWLDHRDHDRNCLPLWVGQKIDQYLTDIALRFQKIKLAYTRVANEFEAVATEFVVIKGFSLFPGYTARPGLRPQGDIDVLCPADSANRAQQTLLSLGYVAMPHRVENVKDQLPTMMPRTSWKPGPSLFDPEMPISIEVHYRLWDGDFMRFSIPGVDHFWNRRTKRQIDGFAFPSLHPVDNLGCSTVHILRELLQGLPTIEQLHSIARFLHTQSDNDAFWQSWRELHEPSLRRLEAMVFRLASDWFGCKVSSAVQDEMDQMPAFIQAWFNNTSRSGLYPHQTHEKSGAWLHFLLLQSISDRMRVLRRVFFQVGFRPELKNCDVSDDLPGVEKARQRFAKYGTKMVVYLRWFIYRSAIRLSKFPSFLVLGFRLWFSKFNLSKEF